MDPHPLAGPTRRGRLGLPLLLALLVALDAFACAARPPRVEPVPPAASTALAEARARLREGADESEVRARAEEALRIDPGWVAPQRLLDDLARTDLRASEVLAERLEGLAERPDDPGLLYLVGRLEGAAGTSRFERALELDPALGWAYHGAGWMRFRAGQSKSALRYGRKAIDRARDDWERMSFAIAVARYEDSRGRSSDAIELLEGIRRAPDLSAADRIELEIELARIELSSDETDRIERGFWRVVDVLRSPGTTDDEERLLAAMGTAAAGVLSYGEAREELAAALAARPGDERRRLRAELLLRDGSESLALAAFERGVPSGVAYGAEAVRLRAARFARGDGAAVLDDWLAELPPQVMAEDGLPRREELRDLVVAARSSGDAAGRRALAEALLRAGWYAEARGLASRLAAEDPDLALSVEARAASGRALVGGIRRLLDLVDDDEDYAGPRDGMDEPGESGDDAPGYTYEPDEEVGDLDGLLAAMQPLFDRHAASGDAASLADSPRLSFGPFGRVVHPGPSFSTSDERNGLGDEGEPVGGLGAELLARGRFGIFGESVGGGGPDGTVLRLLALEQRSGEHLGVPYGGWVAWCDGTDVPSRPVRRGARISGAALHEGYWIDVGGVRGDHARWLRLEREFLVEEDGLRGRTALAGRGPLLPTGAPRALRAAVYAPLGEGDRIRLAVLDERAASPQGRMSFGELIEVVARHEEGHLTDRSRFLPLSKHFFTVLRLLFGAGFSPTRIAGLLEYRAQLVALCVVDDPRIPLAECVDSADELPGPTAHAAAYTELLGDLLEVLAADLESHAVLDPDHYVLHQLHFLSAEEIRRAARTLAEKKGMVRD